MFKNIKIPVLLACLFLAACDTTNNEPLYIGFSADSSKIVVSGITAAAKFEIERNLQAAPADQHLVSVTQIPADNDTLTMEIDFPGTLNLSGDSLFFTPDQAFAKGKNYLVQTMINAKFATAKEIIKAKVGHQVKAQQKILYR
jgi:hypothetical protein